MELRHLRYFVATVEWKSLREASRRIHVAQPAVSQTISNLESELGVKLLTRSGGRSVKLTAEGQLFYEESLKTLKQADHSIEFVQRAARGEVGTLSIGFCGGSTYAFLPELVRKFKKGRPGVKVNLLELMPADQEAAFLEGAIDAGFTRPLSPELSLTHHSRVLYHERLFAVLPSSHRIKAKSIKVEDLAGRRFVLFHRKASPQLFDRIIALCNERGFSPNVEQQPDMLQTAITLVAADQGVSIVPTCALSLQLDGVQVLQLKPDHARLESVIAWPKASKSSSLDAFIDLVEDNRDLIQRKSKIAPF